MYFFSFSLCSPSAFYFAHLRGNLLREEKNFLSSSTRESIAATVIVIISFRRARGDLFLGERRPETETVCGRVVRGSNRCGCEGKRAERENQIRGEEGEGDEEIERTRTGARRPEKRGPREIA